MRRMAALMRRDPGGACLLFERYRDHSSMSATLLAVLAAVLLPPAFALLLARALRPLLLGAAGGRDARGG